MEEKQKNLEYHLSSLLKENETIGEKVNILEQANAEQDFELRLKRHTVEKLKQELMQTREILEKRTLAIREKDKIMKKSISAQYSMLDNFTKLYYEIKDTSEEKRKIYEAVTKEVIRIRDDRNFRMSLESVVNSRLDNLMDDFNTDFSDAKDWARQLFLFSVLDFSVKSICFFQEIPEQTVYNRRTQLKKLILSKDEKTASRYLQYL